MADYYLKTDNIMKNMFTVALKDELAAQSQMGKVRPATEAMMQKVRDYELSEKRLPITTGEQRELRNALNRLRDNDVYQRQVFHGRHGTHITDQREHCKKSGGADRSGDEGSEKDQGKDQPASDVKGTAGNEVFHHSS